MTCYRCGLRNEPSVSACRNCGCVAFHHGPRPEWPPALTYTCDGSDGCDRSLTHVVGHAYLLGPIPASPRIVNVENGEPSAREHAKRAGRVSDGPRLGALL